MRTKYPRTYHLPFSLGATDDDKTLSNTNHFEGKRVIITEKMDGENFTGYSDGYTHARSIDSRHHFSRNWAKTEWANKVWLLQEGLRVCCENLYAQHSITYDNLESYLYGFSIWQDELCYGWDATKEILDKIGLTTVPVLYDGIWDEDKVKEIIANLDLEKQEGIVVRIADSFFYEDFPKSVAKWVRSNHVQTDDHWMSQEIKPNKLKVN